MEYPNPYLIQRLTRNKVEGPLKQYRFGQVWSLDYMGSAEFEFGAFPKFLRRMKAAATWPFTANINGVRVYGIYDPTSYPTEDMVVAVLQDIADGKTRHKEMPSFPATASYFKNVSGWADIANGLFWSTENMNYAIVQIIENSVEYMDEQAKNRM